MDTNRRLSAARHSHIEDAAFALSLAAFLVAFVSLFGAHDSPAVAGSPSEKVVAETPSTPSPSVEPAGVAAAGTPIYRIPGMTVSASRAVEMARIEAGSRSARAAVANASAI